MSLIVGFYENAIFCEIKKFLEYFDRRFGKI